MIDLPKPIIASVNGPAVAGGAGLVLACDIVVATPTAQFGLPEPRRGIIAGIVAPLLAFRAGGSTAARLLLTSALIPAEEALRLNIYHELIDEPRLWARCAQLGEECAAGAPEARATHQTAALRNHRRATIHATHRRRRNERNRPHNRSRPGRPRRVHRETQAGVEVECQNQMHDSVD